MIQKKDIDLVNQAILDLTGKPNQQRSREEWLAIFTLVKELAEERFIAQTQQPLSPTQTQEPPPIMKRGRIRRM